MRTRTQALELPRRAHKDGRRASHQGSLPQQSSMQQRMLNRRRTLLERSRICERAHRQRPVNRHDLPLHLPHHGLNLLGNVLRLLLVQERQDSILGRQRVMSHLFQAATIAQGQHQSDISNRMVKKPQNNLLPFHRDHHRLRCLIP